MQNRTLLATLLISAMLLWSGAYASTAAIHAPAVLSGENAGVLTTITVNVTPGNGAVAITGPSYVGNSTILSAKIAVGYVSGYLGINESRYNFTYDIMDSSSNVSGPSAGLAFSLLAYAGLEGKSIYPNFTVTGTISPNGAVGEVGGVYDKLTAAKAAGMIYAVVPATLGPSDPQYTDYYILQQKAGIPLFQVSNMTQAIKYAINPVESVPPFFQYKNSENFHLGSIPDANVSCTSCNLSYFRKLTNYTLNYTSLWVDSLPQNMSGAKDVFLSDIANYSMIASKGYYYAAADYAFLQFSNEFPMASQNNLTFGYAYNVTYNTEAFCRNLTAPQLTYQNYEYVIGGELRQGWALYQINQTMGEVKASHTTDDVVYSLSALAPAIGWCGAAQNLYSEASAIGGTPAQYPSALANAALAGINRAKQSVTDPFYLTSAENAYSKGEYGAALYALAYARAFGPQTPTLQNSTAAISGIEANAANATYGVWPSQLADSALFSMHENLLISGDNASNLTSAYITSVLARNLSSINMQISSSLVPYNASQQTQVQSLNQSQFQYLTNTINLMFGIMLIMLVLMGIIALALLFVLLRLKDNSEYARERETPKPRKKR